MSCRCDDISDCINDIHILNTVLTDIVFTKQKYDDVSQSQKNLLITESVAYELQDTYRGDIKQKLQNSIQNIENDFQNAQSHIQNKLNYLQHALNMMTREDNVYHAPKDDDDIHY
ncbi:MAG: hypothetical protein WAX04_07600 [Oscillospiraceae bacterium]